MLQPMTLSRCLVAVAALLVTMDAAVADVTLPNVFGSKMVLQRDKDIRIWGSAEPAENVTVKIEQNQATATAGDDGKWMVSLPAMSAGGPYEVSVSGKNTLKLMDVLIGEVWVCSGQSNMEWPVSRAVNPKQEIAAAKYPNIRLFHIPRKPAGTPQTDVNATWKECQPATVPSFSAVAYFFGRHLHKHIDVPIGLIGTSWGGTRIEPWTPVAGFEQVPSLKSITESIKTKKRDYARLVYRERNKKGKLPPHPLANRGQPTGLYNGMIHPIVPLSIGGAIWYQGEANRRDGFGYEQKMHALIKGWRSVFHQGDFAFLYVQLAPYQYGNEDPEFLAKTWEAQRRTLALPNTGMAVITDIGNLQNIHPTNKQEVGRRLALWALANSYGKKDLVYSGPLFKSISVKDGKVRVNFDHTGSGLASRDGKPLTWFSIAGKDDKFVEAQAEIDGASVVVSSDKVPKPTAVRLGWHKLAEPNLINKEGLPASPFQSRGKKE